MHGSEGSEENGAGVGRADDLPITVVIADDTTDIRMLLKLLLDADERFEVVGQAVDGAEALEVMGSAKPEALILDLAMPVMDGLEVLDRVAEVSPAPKVLVLSGFGSNDLAGEAIRRGALAYVTKGSDLKRVTAEVYAMCRGQKGPDGTDHAPDETRDPNEGLDPGDLDEVLLTLIHELQSPVTVILNYAAALRSSVQRMDFETARAGSAAIERSARNLQALIHAFADARSIESGHLTLALAETDVTRHVAELVNDMGPVLKPHPVELQIGEQAVITIDPVRVRQVLTNLLDNAAKFTPASSPIEVAVTREGTAVLISVTDHGTGVPRGLESQLFKKFSRLGSKRPGTGLGLFVSRGIALAHGGELTCDSIEGYGSRFTLSLPC